MPYGLRIGFAFSTKDRVEFTRRSLASIDTDEGFDRLWVDGSVRPEGRRLPHQLRLRNPRLSPLHGLLHAPVDRGLQHDRVSRRRIWLATQELLH